MNMEQRLRVALMQVVDVGLCELEVAQMIQDLVFAPGIEFGIGEGDSADRFIGPVGSSLGQFIEPLGSELLEEGAGSRSTSGVGGEAEKPLGGVDVGELGLGDAVEAAAAAGHIGLCGQNSKYVPSREEVLNCAPEEEGNGVVLKVGKDALLGLRIASEGFLRFDDEAETGTTGVQDVVSEGDPLGGFDAECGSHAKNGGG